MPRPPRRGAEPVQPASRRRSFHGRRAGSRREADSPDGDGHPHSLKTLSAHATNATRSGGVTNRAFWPARSASRTARAREHAVQTLIGISCSIVLCRISESGGQPTGVTDLISASFIRFTASPRRKSRTSCPASAKALGPGLCFFVGGLGGQTGES